MGRLLALTITACTTDSIFNDMDAENNNPQTSANNN